MRYLCIRSESRTGAKLEHEKIRATTRVLHVQGRTKENRWKEKAKIEYPRERDTSHAFSALTSSFF